MPGQVGLGLGVGLKLGLGLGADCIPGQVGVHCASKPVGYWAFELCVNQNATQVITHPGPQTRTLTLALAPMITRTLTLTLSRTLTFTFTPTPIPTVTVPRTPALSLPRSTLTARMGARRRGSTKKGKGA